MIRAGVFIGVDRTGGLQRLHDGAAGAVKMREWALRQGMRPEDAVLITDQDGAAVTPDDIYGAISGIVNGPGVDQLLIYFAGHGINLNRGEQWLLSDAPVRSSAAVDVRSSVELARYCGIPHVVVISDACRVAPEGIQAQGVRGVDIFPNDGVGDRARPVDQFFACLLGRTAAELRDPQEAASTYSALYTHTLLDGLSGHVPAVIESLDPAGPPRFVRPRRLQSWLETEIPARVLARGLQNKVNQNPDAIITSDAAWLAEVEQALEAEAPTAPPTRGPVRGGEREPGASGAADGAAGADAEAPTAGPPTTGAEPPTAGAEAPTTGAEPPSGAEETTGSLRPLPALGALPTTGRVLERMTWAALGEQEGLGDSRADLAASGVGRDLLRTAEEVSSPFGPDHFETECGVKVRGTTLLEVVAGRAQAEVVTPELARVVPSAVGATSVVVSFDGGTGTVIPVLPGFVAGLTVEDGELVDVAYEPSTNSWRWSEFEHRAEELRFLRGVASSASRHGRFRLDNEQAPSLARRMQTGKGFDPTLAVYAAYAYSDLQDLEHLEEMSSFLRGDLGVGLFDVELLARHLVDVRVGPDVPVLPAAPLLAQGWGVLRAHRVRLPVALDGLGDHLLESVWSLYDPQGVALLCSALVKGEMR